MLDKRDTWSLFCEVRLDQPNIKFFRFEDYKRDAIGTLRRVLDFTGIEASESEVSAVVDRSSFEQVVKAEKQYCESNPQDKQIINRASKVGSWKEPGSADDVASIVSRCRSQIMRFKYIDVDGAVHHGSSYLPHSRLIHFYSTELDQVERYSMHMTGTLKKLVEAGRLPVTALPYVGNWGDVDSRMDLEYYLDNE